MLVSFDSRQMPGRAGLALGGRTVLLWSVGPAQRSSVGDRHVQQDIVYLDVLRHAQNLAANPWKCRQATLGSQRTLSATN